MKNETLKDTEEWHKIGNQLCDYFGICRCQRKLKSIIHALYNIYQKCNQGYNDSSKRNFTGAEWLLIAILDRHSDMIQHGINCEYPIINESSEIWKFILKEKDSPYLEDN